MSAAVASRIMRDIAVFFPRSRGAGFRSFSVTPPTQRSKTSRAFRRTRRRVVAGRAAPMKSAAVPYTRISVYEALFLPECRCAWFGIVVPHREPPGYERAETSRTDREVL